MQNYRLFVQTARIYKKRNGLAIVHRWRFHCKTRLRLARESLPNAVVLRACLVCSSGRFNAHPATHLYARGAAAFQRGVHTMPWLWSTPARSVAQEVEFCERDIREENDIGSMIDLAFILFDGDVGVPRERKRAVQLFKRAFKQGGAHEALKELERYYRYHYSGAGGAGGEAEEEEEEEPPVEPHELALLNSQFSAAAFQAAGLEQDVKFGDAFAMVQLARLLERGKRGVKRDTDRAVQLCERAVKQEQFWPAMAWLAKRHWRGSRDGAVKADRARAIELYEEAVKQGAGTETVVAYSMLLVKGRERGEKDRGVALLERAIKQEECVEATEALCQVLAFGLHGVQANARRAVELCAVLVREKRFCGQLVSVCAGYLYDGEGGVEVNRRRAIKWWKRAVNGENDGLGMLRLGEAYERGGDGIKRDVGKALSLYGGAVEEGYCWWGVGSRHSSVADVRVKAAMKVARIVRCGAGGVKRDMKRAFEMYEMGMFSQWHVEAITGVADIVTKLCGDAQRCEREMGFANVADGFEDEETARRFALDVIGGELVNEERVGTREKKVWLKVEARKGVVCKVVLENVMERHKNSRWYGVYMGELGRVYRDGAAGVEANKQRALDVYKRERRMMGSWSGVWGVVREVEAYETWGPRAVEMMEWAESEGVGEEDGQGDDEGGDGEDGGESEGGQSESDDCGWGADWR